MESIPRRLVFGLTLLPISFEALPSIAVGREDSIYDFEVDFKQKPVSLDKYKGQNLNYPGLRTFKERYGGKGFNLIAFPCNQFGGQAPGTSEEERAAAIKKFGFEFDVYDKINVNGEEAHPLYKYLKMAQPETYPRTAYRRTYNTSEVEWNYTKFLIDRNGQPVRRYGSGFDPLKFEGDVVKLLKGEPILPEECLTDPDNSRCVF